MDEKDPSIKDIISQVEEMGKPEQSFFKKPVGIATVIFIIIVFVVLLLLFIPSNKYDKSKTESIQEISSELSKDRTSTQPIDKEEVRKELAKPKNSTLTEEEKQSIRESLAQ